MTKNKAPKSVMPTENKSDHKATKAAHKRDSARIKLSTTERVSALLGEPKRKDAKSLLGGAIESFASKVADANGALLLVKPLRKHKAAKLLRKIEKALSELLETPSGHVDDAGNDRPSLMVQLHTLAKAEASRAQTKLDKKERAIQTTHDPVPASTSNG